MHTHTHARTHARVRTAARLSPIQTSERASWTDAVANAIGFFRGNWREATLRSAKIDGTCSVENGRRVKFLRRDGREPGRVGAGGAGTNCGTSCGSTETSASDAISSGAISISGVNICSTSSSNISELVQLIDAGSVMLLDQ